MKMRLDINFAALFLAALILVMGAADSAFDATVSVVAPPVNALLSDGALWQVPIGRIAPLQSMIAIPFWLYGACLSFVTAAIAWAYRERGRWVLPVLFLPAVTFAGHPSQAVTLLLFALTGWCGAVAASEGKRPRWLVVCSLCLAVVAVLTSLEFGLLLSLLCLELLGIRGQETATSRRLPGLAVLLVVTGITVGAVLSPGFQQALLRPVTAGAADPLLYSSLDLFAQPLPKMLGNGLCYMVILACVWQRMIQPGGRLRHITVIWAAFISVYCLPCAVLVVVYLAARTVDAANQNSEAPQTRRESHRWTWSYVVLAVVAFLMLSSYRGVSLLAGQHSERLVDVSGWRFDGPVFLTDVSQASHWTAAHLEKRFPVLAGDRWDDNLRGNAETEYRRAVYDLLSGRREHYQRSDGAFGGYQPFFDQHNVVAVTMDTRQLPAIREFSVDRVWRVMALDAERVIFGRSDVPATAAQTRRAGQLLFQLEWPKPTVAIQPDGILAIGNRVDSRAVARVLNAIRLPYAALRVVADDTTASAREVRVWSYVELANRALRHCGRPSLIDHYRAVHGLQQLRGSFFASRAALGQIERALTVLRVSSDCGEVNGSAVGDAECVVRAHLLRGNRQAAADACTDLDSASVSKFYRTLCGVLDDSPEKLLAGLGEVSANDQIRPDLRDEAAFYMGCLALELGDAQKSRAAFLPGSTLSDVSPWQPLRDLHYGQLSP